MGAPGIYCSLDEYFVDRLHGNRGYLFEIDRFSHYFELSEGGYQRFSEFFPAGAPGSRDREFKSMDFAAIQKL